MPFDGTMNPVVLELQIARGRIERGWCQRRIQTLHGEVCLLGALEYTKSGEQVLTPAAAAVARQTFPKYKDLKGTPPLMLAMWNDDLSRTKAEVLAVLDQAIAAESLGVGPLN
jgi:hypothetical protein